MYLHLAGAVLDVSAKRLNVFVFSSQGYVHRLVVRELQMTGTRGDLEDLLDTVVFVQ